MATKKEERAANQQKAQELARSREQQAPISRDTDIDYPLTSPAAKQQADRLAQDKEGAFSKPFPTGSNLASPAIAPTEPRAQTPGEFEETGGQKITDNPKAAPDTGGDSQTTNTNLAAETTGDNSGEQP